MRSLGKRCLALGLALCMLWTGMPVGWALPLTAQVVPVIGVDTQEVDAISSAQVKSVSRSTMPEDGETVSSMVGYETVDRETALVSWTRPRLETGVHAIAVVDISIDNTDAANLMRGVLSKGESLRDGYYKTTGTDADTVIYRNVVSATSGLGGLTNNRDIGTGQANAPAVLDKVLEMLDSVKEGKRPVVFWVLSPERKLEASRYLEQTKVKFAEVRAKLASMGGELISWQLDDEASPWLSGSNVHAHAAGKDAFADEAWASLEKVVSDYIEDFTLTLPLEGPLAVRFVEGSGKVGTSDPRQAGYLRDATFEISEDGRTATVRIPKMYNHVPATVSCGVALNTECFEAAVVTTPSVFGRHYKGVLDDDEPLPEYGAAEADRTRRQAAFIDSRNALRFKTVEAFPGQFVAAPDADDWEWDGATFTGWAIEGNEKAYYQPGEMVRMPETGIRLYSTLGSTGVDLLLGDVTPDLEKKNRMFGGDEKMSWDNFRRSMWQRISTRWNGYDTYHFRNAKTVTVVDEKIPFQGDLLQVTTVKGGCTYNGKAGQPNAIYVGADKENPVVAYILDSEKYPGYYDLYIAGNGGVTAPESCSRFFNNSDSGYVNIYEVDLHLLDVSNVRDMSHMFRNMGNLISINLDGWDTSNVVNMAYMFYDSSSNTYALPDVSEWNTSSVVDMSYMFACRSKVESIDVSKWDTSKVKDMSYMFVACNKLNTLDVSNWDTSSLENSSYMFRYCSQLDMDVEGWDTSNIIDMQSMFESCQCVTELDLSGWNTSKVENMRDLFSACNKLISLNLTGWNTSNVKDMAYMFSGCHRLSGLNVSSFDTSNVTNMAYMFHGCQSLETLDLSGFDTSNVTNMQDMFHMYNRSDMPTLQLKSIDFSGINTAKVINASRMFYDCVMLTSLKLNILNLSSMTTMEEMFYNCRSLESLNLKASVDAGSSVQTNMGKLFSRCQKLKYFDFSGFDTSHVVSMNYMFEECRELESVSLAGIDSSRVKSLYGMFNSCMSLSDVDLSPMDTQSVTNMSYMFQNCKALTHIDLSVLDMSSTTHLGDMFCGCDSLQSVDLQGLDSSSWKEIFGMFHKCSSLRSVDLSGLDLTSVTHMGCMFEESGLESFNLGELYLPEVLSMSRMFSKCADLKECRLLGLYAPKLNDLYYMFDNSGIESIDMHDLDLPAVTTMERMFGSCKNLVEVNLEGLNIPKVTKMSGMFSGCSGLESVAFHGVIASEAYDLSSLFSGCTSLKQFSIEDVQIPKLKNIGSLFSGCSSLMDVKFVDWDTSGVTNMSGMFSGCQALTAIDLSNIDTSSVINMNAMFSYCTSLTNLDLSSVNTVNTTDMDAMFYRCSSLEHIEFGDQFKLCQNIRRMFTDCFSLKSVEGLKFKDEVYAVISTLKDDYYGIGMFQGCSSLEEIDLSSMGGKEFLKLTSIQSMFEGCKSLKKVNMNGWNMQNLSNMSRMFYDTGNNELELDLSWNLAGSTMNTTSILYDRIGPVKLEIGNYDEEDNVYAQKRTIMTAFQAWESPEQGKTLTVTSNGVQIYPAEVSSLSATQEVEYRIEFYYDGELTRTKTLQGEIGAEVTYEAEDVDGYEVAQVEPITLTENAEENVITVKYSKIAAVEEFQDKGSSKEEPEVKSEDEVQSEEEVEETAGEPEDTESKSEEEPEDTESKSEEEAEETAVESEDSEAKTEEEAESEGDLEAKSVEAESEGDPEAKVEGKAEEGTNKGVEEVNKSLSITPTSTSNRIVSTTAWSAMSNKPNALAVTALKSAKAPTVVNQVKTAVLAGYYNTASRSGTIDNDAVDYTMAIPTATEATPLGTIVQYIVRVKYEGDYGAKSGELNVRYPLPGGVVPAGDGSVEVGAMMQGDNYYDTTEDKVTKEFKVSGDAANGYELTGAIRDVVAGTHVDVTVNCVISKLVDETEKEVETGRYWSWTGTAYATASNHSAVSNPLRLWDFYPNPGVTEVEPPVSEEARVNYELVGDVPEGVQVPETEFKAAGDKVTLEEPVVPAMWEFEGWFRKNEDGSLGAKVTEYTVTEDDVVKGITFVGKWKLRDLGSMTVVYQYESGTGYDVPPSLKGSEVSTTIRLGTKTSIAKPMGVEFYDFAGWYKVKVNGAESGVLPKEGQLDTSKDEYGLNDGDTVVYVGGYTAHVGTIKFNANGAAGAVPADQNVKLGDPEGELQGAGGLSKAGWSFQGWSTKADGTGDIYGKGTPVSAFVKDGLLEKDGTLNLYAIWEEDPAKVLVSKGVDKTRVEPGEEVIYEIVIAADEAVSGVKVLDVLDGNLGLVGANLDGVEVMPEGSVYTIGDLAQGEDVTLTIVAKVKGTVPAGTKIKNSVTVEYNGVPGTKKPQSEIEVVVKSIKVEVKIEYTDPDGNVVKTEIVPVDKGGNYDVTSRVESGVPDGWIKDSDRTGDPTKGIADKDKTVKVPVKKSAKPVVEITIQYTNTKGEIIKTETVKVEQGSNYDVTDKVDAGVPKGWIKDESKKGDPTTGTATKNKTVKVPVRKPDGAPEVEATPKVEMVYNGEPQPLPKDKVEVRVNGNPVPKDQFEVTEYWDKDGKVVPGIPTDAGEYTVEITVYDPDGGFVDTVIVKYTIKPAVLVAVYEGEVIRPGDTPDLKVKVIGFVNGETEDTAKGYKAPKVSLGKVNLNKAGEYTLSPADGEAKNYVFEYKSGVLNIWKPKKKPSFGHVIEELFKPKPQTGEIKNPETGR